MRLTLRQLQIFLAISQTHSTTAAAGIVSLSQSATSAALNELETVLNIQLFDRIGKRLILNDNGRLLLPQARQILDTAATVEAQFSAADTGVAVGMLIGASTTIGNYLLPAMLGAYGDPGSKLQPRVMIANTADIAKAVAEFEVDIGLIEGPCHEPDLHVESWLLDELIIVCAPAHPLARRSAGSKTTLKELREAGWLLREPGSGTREAVEHALVPHLHALRQAGEFSSAEAIKHAAAASLGIACLSRYVVADLIELGRLVQVRTSLPKLSRHFYLVHSRRKILSTRLSHFLQFCRAWET